MSGFFQDLLKGAAAGFFGNDTLRDYTHAAKTFQPDAYAFAPKYKFLFHTYFNINTDVVNINPNQNIGLLVHDVRLPSYTFQTVQLNQYNRKRIIQTKIRYEPVTITFHDDNQNNITKMWQRYYNYYYADGARVVPQFAGARGGSPPPVGNNVGQTDSPALSQYNKRTVYEKSISGDENWGYVGDTTSPDLRKQPFFKDITVFGFNQKNYTAYTLINPIITQFGHDTYNYDEGNGTMKNTMTIDYETVTYNYGKMDDRSPSDIVTGFGVESNDGV